MNDLPRSAIFYICIIFGLGTGAALASSAALLNDPTLISYAAVLAVVIAILDLLPVPFRKHQSEVLISTAVKLAGVILMPASVVILAVFCGTVLSELRLKKVWYKLVFNAGSLTLTYVIVTLMYHLVNQPEFNILASPRNIAALFLIGVTDVAVNSMLMSLILSKVVRLPFLYLLAETYKPVMWHNMSMLPIGVFIAMLWKTAPESVVLAAVPLLLARHSYKMVSDLEHQTEEALQALARVLDERDEQTSAHSELVSNYSAMIARAMGLSLSEVDVIARAAWLHDIGKVGMRNDILYKPGALTTQERELAKRHAAIGGELLKKFPLFEKGAIYVRHHHEWWNGKGYPDGLAGDAIPLGARILAVADAYQAMTDDRPYRKPLGENAALLELRRGAGIQFDPRVVEAFFRAKGLTPSPRGAMEDTGLTLSPLAAEEEVLAPERVRMAV